MGFTMGLYFEREEQRATMLSLVLAGRRSKWLPAEIWWMITEEFM
jgi:hypothetical protein